MATPTYLGYPQVVYDSTGESIAASGTYKTAIIGIPSHKKSIKIFVELTYHASATLGGRVDILPIQPDGATENTDSYVTATTPSFAAAGTKSKLGSPVDVDAVRQIKLAVVNLDPAQAMTLKKLYIY